MALILGGTDYGSAWCSSGARNFFGEGWPHHRWLATLGLSPDFAGSTLVTKTTTVEPRAGNMPLDGTSPREFRPRCVRVNFRRAAVLNAVGLSGPGAKALLDDGRWQSHLSPFVISFMATEGDREGRVAATSRFASMLADGHERFSSPFALQLNFSCPNVGLDPSRLVAEVGATLAMLSDALPAVPLMPKFNVLVPPGVAAEVGCHPNCSAVCASNTLPWGALPDRIGWGRLFGATSPLASFGGGGLSGAPLTNLVRGWAGDYLSHPDAAPLVAGGGVMSPADAIALLELGSSAIEIGSVAMVRPWRVRSIIKAINAWEPRSSTKEAAACSTR